MEEFLGSPLLGSRITANYDIVAQILAEMADAGVPSESEPNALRDVVETGPGVLNNLLGKVGIAGAGVPILSSGVGGGGGVGGGVGSQRMMLRPPVESAQGSAIPWRRGNVRHTSNELYVDIVETLAVTLAPSGRALSAFAYGSIVFTAKVSGVPDLLLHLSPGGPVAGMDNRGDQLRCIMERAVFHPCVRLNRWKADGVLSFVPPDGKFVLAGYEVDLLGPDAPLTATSKTTMANRPLNLPATIEVTTGLGHTGNEFETRLFPVPTSSAAAASLQSHLVSKSATNRPASFRSGSGSDSKGLVLDDLHVRVPLPASVRSVSELRPSRGEAHWSPADSCVEWRVPCKDFGAGGGVAVLRCTVQGPLSDDYDDDKTEASSASEAFNGVTTTTYDYTDDVVEPVSAYQSQNQRAGGKEKGRDKGSSHTYPPDDKRVEKNRELMPTSATLSFGVKGWLASGLKVESLLVDAKKSRGLGADVKPYKGVKYLTVSRDGIEVRC